MIYNVKKQFNNSNKLTDSQQINELSLYQVKVTITYKNTNIFVENHFFLKEKMRDKLRIIHLLSNQLKYPFKFMHNLKSSPNTVINHLVYVL